MKKPICKNCLNYTAYYMQETAGFKRLTNGFCNKHDKPQSQNDDCPFFFSNELWEAKRERRRLKFLEQSLKSIYDIVCIQKEQERDENY